MEDVKHLYDRFATKEPLLGCGPLPHWLKGKRCIYALDGTEERVDNLCMWRCLTVHFRGYKKQREKRTTREALNLVREYYEDPNLKREDVRAMKLGRNIEKVRHQH